MKTISVAGDRVVLLVTGEETQQRYTIMEATLPPNAGPPPHVHAREDESFHVLTGEVTFHLADKIIVLKQGDSIFAPRNLTHYFKNTGHADAVLLEIASPAGIERFFEAVGRPLKRRDDRPFPPSPEDLRLMRQKAPEFEIEILV